MNVASEDTQIMFEDRNFKEGSFTWKSNDSQGNALSCDQIAQHFLGYKEKTTDHLFNDAKKWIHSEDLIRFKAKLDDLLLDKELTFFDLSFRHESKHEIFHTIFIKAVAQRSSEGNLESLSGWVFLGTDSEKENDKIDAEREMLSNILEDIPLTVYLKDKDSKFVMGNKALVKRLGKGSIESVIGKTDHDFFEALHADKKLKDEQYILETKEPMLEVLEQEIWEDGRETHVITSKVPWLDKDGDVKGTFGVSGDVTSLVKTQQQLMEMTYKLTARNQSMREEMELAHQIQLSMIEEGKLTEFPPVGTPDKNGRLNFAYRYVPASGMAGDLFQVTPLSDSKVGVFMCDVMGHGVRSALIVSMLRGLMEKERGASNSPEKFLTGINSGLASILKRAGVTMFATAFYAVVDLEKKEILYANAGHPSPILVNKEENVRLYDKVKVAGPALGIVDGFNYQCGTLSLEQFDRLLLFTDGVYEAEDADGEEFGVDGMMNVLNTEDTIEDSLISIMNSAKEHASSETFDDDVCLLGIRWIAPQ